MRNVLRVGKDVKARRMRAKELMDLNLSALEREAKPQLIQELIPLGLMHIGEVLREEVEALAGDRYKRNGLPGHVRWTRQWGSVYIGEQKIPIVYQRVRDSRKGKQVALASYRRLQEPRGVDEKLLKKILLGLSCRRYRECSETIPEAFSLSSSTVSRRFIRASTKKLKQFMDRRLDERDVVAIVIDGKSFKDDEMIVALGVTAEGKKVVLGFIQAATENASVCKDFLNGLLERGLTIEEGLLCVMDGSKGIRKAVEEIEGGGGNNSRSSATSSIPSGKGRDKPASSARRKYSETVVRPMEQLFAICLLLRPHSHFRRNTSFTFRMDNLFADICTSLLVSY